MAMGKRSFFFSLSTLFSLFNPLSSLLFSSLLFSSLLLFLSSSDWKGLPEGNIPPNADLEFEVELLAAGDDEASSSVCSSCAVC